MFSLPGFSIRHPVSILMVLVAVAGVGLIACFRMPLKFLPEMDLPYITCYLSYPGATPEQVEREVAVPAEGEFTTISHLQRISSNSNSSGCQVSMSFTSGTNMATATAEVRDRIERLKLDLPKEIDRVMLMRHSSNSMPILAVGLFMKGDEKEFVHLVRTVIEPRLSRLEGVAEVRVYAASPEPEVLIEFDQNALRTHNVALYQVITDLQSADLNISAGNLADGALKYYVRTENELKRPEDYANLIVSPTGLRLKDIAKVGFHSREVEGQYDIDDKGGAFIIVLKESEANTVDTCKVVRDELERIKTDPVFEEMEQFPFFDQSEMILASLNALVDAGKMGGLFSIAVLYIFLLRIRPTLVISLAIPTSLLAALAYMFFTGMSLNVVTMTSLIVAVGMLVDDAIVVIENIYRYFQLGKSPEEAAVRGAQEVGIAITASTITSVVVFVPVLYMQSGELAAYMRQFAIPMTASLFASLFVALTLIPLAFSRMKDRHDLWIYKVYRHAVERSGIKRALPAPGSLLGRMMRIHPLNGVIAVYARCLDVALRQRTAAFLMLLAVLLATGMIPGRQVGMRKMPPLDLRQVDIDVKLDQNFNLSMARDIFTSIKTVLNKQRDELGIKSIFTRCTSEGGGIEVHLRKPEDYPAGEERRYSTQEVLDILRQRFPKRLPGAELQFSVPAEDNEGEAAQSITVRMMGTESARLDEYAHLFAKVMVQVPNISDVKVNNERAKQEIQLAIDEPLANHLGVSPLVVARTVDVALRGNQLPALKQAGREYNVWAQFREEDRKSRDNLDNVTVIGSTGVLTPLNQLVTYRKSTSPARIQRVDSKNVITISGRIETTNYKQIQKDMQARISSFEMPLGYTIDLGEQFTEMETSLSNFLMTLVMAIILIYIVMAALFESLLLPLSILTSVPLAFVGVYWALFVTKTPFDTVGIIGCILLVGVVVKNGIVIVDHINFLRKTEGMERHAAVLQAGRDRLRPVWMTAMTTILGAVPLAVEGSGGNSISFICLGRAFIGGLISGTVLTLIVVPLFYVVIDDAQEWIRHYIASLRSLGHRTPEAIVPIVEDFPLDTP